MKSVRKGTKSSDMSLSTAAKVSALSMSGRKLVCHPCNNIVVVPYRDRWIGSGAMPSLTETFTPGPSLKKLQEKYGELADFYICTKCRGIYLRNFHDKLIRL